MNSSKKPQLAVIVFLVLVVCNAYSCPPVLESDFTVRGPGGSYGYMHLSFNNQRWQPGQPRRHHQRVLLLGPVSFNLSASGLIGVALGVGVISFLAAGWRWFASKEEVSL